MHHHFGSKFLIDTLNSHGFCSSYSEVKTFEVSAADAQEKEIPGYIPGQFSQFTAGNVDHNVRTMDGANTFHGIGIIAVRSLEVRCNKPITSDWKNSRRASTSVWNKDSLLQSRHCCTSFAQVWEVTGYQHSRLDLESRLALENFMAIKITAANLVWHDAICP